MSNILNDLKDMMGYFDARKSRARERLAKDDLTAHWHFALLGVSATMPEIQLEKSVALRPVIDPPGEVELAAALKDKSMLNIIGRYSHSINYELSIERSFASNAQGAFNLAWWFISALRIRTLADFLVPAVSNFSWSTIAGVPEGSCIIRMIEDVPRARRISPSVSISEEEIFWVRDNLSALARLLELPRFRLAVDCFTTHQHEASLRMTAASLWAGIEAIFAINAEIRFRISALIAAFLEPPGPQRVSKYREIKKLYDLRSRIVHGATLNDTLIIQHIKDVRLLLSILIRKMIEISHMPSESEWDEILLG